LLLVAYDLTVGAANDRPERHRGYPVSPVRSPAGRGRTGYRRLKKCARRGGETWTQSIGHAWPMADKDERPLEGWTVGVTADRPF